MAGDWSALPKALRKAPIRPSSSGTSACRSTGLRRCGCRGTEQPGSGSGDCGARGSLESGSRCAGVAAALAAALLPKCPFCVAGYAALLGVVGVGPGCFEVWTGGLTLLLGGAALAGLAYKYGASRARSPLLTG